MPAVIFADELAQGRRDVVIRVQGLTRTFGSEVAVDDVTFEVPRGSIFGYIGPSGSGKTTTIRMLTGVLEPSSGEALILGTAPKKFTQSTREKIGYMPQLFVLYPDLSVWENMNFAASIYGMGFRRKRRLDELLDFVELSEHRHKLARNISGGMQRRLSLAATLVHDPELIYLDEPTAGIDPVLRQKFWAHFRELQSQGRTLLITTQYVGETAYCDRVGVMSDGGRLITVDTPDGLRHRAFGGDIVTVQTAERVDYSYLVQLAELPFVRHSPERTEGNGLRLVVDDAATAIPALMDWFGQRSIAIRAAEEYTPPYDEVFVELLRSEGNHAA